MNEDLTKFAWFHGAISREVAEDRLQSADVGTFLVRTSSSHDGYSLSVRTPTKIKHFLINFESNLFQLIGKDETFPSVSELIDHFHVEPTSKTDDLRLKQPCPRPAIETMDGDGDDDASAAYAPLIADPLNARTMATVKALSRQKSQQLGMPAGAVEQAGEK